MTKTEEQLQRDVAATIKLILTELETVAGLAPDVACHPVAFDERRRRVVRKIWALYKEVLAHDPSQV